MEKWFVMRKGAPFQEIAEKFNISSKTIRNHISNVIQNTTFINGDFAKLDDVIDDISYRIDFNLV